MTTLLLIRHATNHAVGRFLAGRLPGIHLDEDGRAQAARLASNLSGVPIAAIYSSPLERAMETAEYIAAQQALSVAISPALTDIEYGDWTGATLAELSLDAEWRRFNCSRGNTRVPSGEMMLEAQMRAVLECARIQQRHADQIIAIITHAEIVRAVVAHYAGISLDAALRIEVEPASVSVVALGENDLRIHCLNQPPEAAAFLPGVEIRRAVVSSK